MDKIAIGKSGLLSGRLIYGCMRIAGDTSPSDKIKGKQAIHAAIESGFDHFDHADIYGRGESEKLFGEFLREEPGLRDRILITSKCGIRFQDDPQPGYPKRYDFSYQHILESVDGSLQRMGIDTLDILLLHRPDFLLQPEEVARAFSRLRDQGKVRTFGVSNFRPSQVSLLRHYCDMDLIVNQIEINIHNISSLVDGTLDQCMETGMTPQAWCPLGGVAYPAWGNTLLPEEEALISEELEQQAKRYGTVASVIALAWLLRHPAGIMPLIGSTRPERIRESTQALDLQYSREDWYRLLEARLGHPVP